MYSKPLAVFNLPTVTQLFYVCEKVRGLPDEFSNRFQYMYIYPRVHKAFHRLMTRYMMLTFFMFITIYLTSRSLPHHFTVFLKCLLSVLPSHTTAWLPTLNNIKMSFLRTQCMQVSPTGNTSCSIHFLFEIASDLNATTGRLDEAWIASEKNTSRKMNFSCDKRYRKQCIIN